VGIKTLFWMEAWILKEIDMRRLEAFEMWIYRRIPEIFWVERVTNVKVRKRMPAVKKKNPKKEIHIKETKLVAEQPLGSGVDAVIINYLKPLYSKVKSKDR